MEKIKELCKSKNLKIYSKAEVNFFYIVTKSYVDMKNEDLEL